MYFALGAILYVLKLQYYIIMIGRLSYNQWLKVPYVRNISVFVASLSWSFFSLLFMVFLRRYVIMLTLSLLLRTTWIIENTGILDLMDHQPLWIGGTWLETFNLGRDYILFLFCLVLVFLVVALRKMTNGVWGTNEKSPWRYTMRDGVSNCRIDTFVLLWLAGMIFLYFFWVRGQVAWASI